MAGAPFRLDPAKETTRIARFIRATVKKAGADGVVVGLSGGIDSAVVGALCVRALGKEKVTSVLMPSRFTPQADIEDAEVLAYTWGVRVKKVEISPLADSLISAFDFESDRVAKANVQARVRMVILYFLSNTERLLVAGTGDKSEEQLGFFCYDSATRAVTPDGLKGMDDLRVGNIVYSLDADTKRIVESRVEGLHKFDYNGKMIHFRGRGSDLVVTPNHKMFVHTSSYRPDSRLTFRRADDCLGYRSTITPVPSYWVGDSGLPMELELTFSQRQIQRRIRLPVEEAFYLLGLFIGDGCASICRVIVPVLSSLSRAEYQNSYRGKDGRFAAISSEISGPHLKEYLEYNTTFALPEYTKDEARDRLIQILRKYRIGHRCTRDTVVVSSRGIYDFFAQCGKGAKNKRIPQWVLRYSSLQLAWLFRGLKDSDGSHSEDQNCYYTSSEGLKDDVVQLCFKMGRRASVTMNPPRRPSIHGKTIMTGRSFTISIARTHRAQHTILNRFAKEIHYEGKVWCPTVPPFDNLLVERNGKYVISGNSKFGDGGVDFLPIAHLYKTQVRELGRHLGLPERVVTKPASPGLWPGHTAAEELPADYDALDPLLYYLFDRKLPPREAAKKAGTDVAVAKKALEMHRKTEHKRSLPPSLS